MVKQKPFDIEHTNMDFNIHNLDARELLGNPERNAVIIDKRGSKSYPVH